MVYECWIGQIPEDKQINHIDDNKFNNHYTNLYAGTQKQNIQDCIRNEHRLFGNSKILMIKDKNTGCEWEFLPASEFFEFSNHPQDNGGIYRVFDRKWFKDNYELIYYGKGVTTREM